MNEKECELDELKEKKTYCYTIDDIANWQKEISNNNSHNTCKITLPSLQRGFIWKSYQIENLWDSILRGYPIGALLMNKVDDYNKELLDGQQRSTSISIGYLNPFKIDSNTQLLNIKKNIPAVWIDLKPVKDSVYGMKFGVRVLTRSHPWGYQLRDNTKPLSTSDREKALVFFREKSNDETKSFSELDQAIINPWDAHLPIPLFILLKSNLSSFEEWSKDIEVFISHHLQAIKTKHSEGYVDYKGIEDNLKVVYKAIVRATKILIPEIVVHQEALEEKEEHVNEDSDDATLFVRLNSEGTRISGEELIYSLLKSKFPKAKELVEKIDVKYIAPSRIVNLFARLSLMEVNNYDRYQKNMNLIGFRRSFSNQEFKDTLLTFIEEAEVLFNRAVDIIFFNKDLPKVYVKHQINKSIDLVFVLLVYLHKNIKLSESEKYAIHKDFHAIALFNEDAKKTAQKFFDVLNRNEFKNWTACVKQLREEQANLVLSLIDVKHFKDTSNLILKNYINDRNNNFTNHDYVKGIFRANKNSLQFLFKNNIKKEEETPEQFENRIMDEATHCWIIFSNNIYWDKTFLILAQKEYFNKEFKDYMEFDGIEDTNRPWDWDHIYPNSWVYKKVGISPLAKHVLNSNGNFRALSFNENRSQSNHQSPKFRFEDKIEAQQDSFIKKNDLKHWLELSNAENRLKESSKSKGKIDALVYASFERMNNIYEEVFKLFNNKY